MPSVNQLAPATLQGYRELLRKLRAEAAAREEATSPAAWQQAKERVLLHVRSRKEKVGRANPRRAFARLRQRLEAARGALSTFSLHDHISELGERKAEAKEALREAYDSVKRQRAAARRRRDELSVVGTDGLFRSFVVAVFGSACKLFMQGLNTTKVEGGSHLEAALARPAQQPLITVSNHIAAMDDPLLLAALTPAELLLEHRRLRWTLCATDRCFKYRLLNPFFTAAKVLPIERGAGMAQAGMTAAEARLNAGDWVHIFPEGTRSRDGKLGPVRKGVGRLVAACQQPPLVLPFVHSGMDGVMPRGASVPRAGNTVRVLVGEPVAVADLLSAAEAEAWPQQRLYAAISDRVGEAMLRLKAELDGEPLPQSLPSAATLDDALLPLIEEEVVSAWARLWRPSVQQASGISAVSSRSAVPHPCALDAEATAEVAAASAVEPAAALRRQLQLLRGFKAGTSSLLADHMRSRLKQVPDTVSDALAAAVDYSRYRMAVMKDMLTSTAVPTASFAH